MTDTKAGCHVDSGRQMGTINWRERLRIVRKRKQARDRLAADRIAAQLGTGERRKKRDH